MKEGEEEDGFTILEFSRKYITCDDNDQPIVVSSLGPRPSPLAYDIHVARFNFAGVEHFKGLGANVT